MEPEPYSLVEFLDGLLRWWLVLLVVPLTLAGIVAAMSASEPVQPLRYKATATILLDGDIGVNNFPRLATARPALDAAVKQAGLSVTVDDLRATVSARLIPGTDFMEIDAVHTQPQIAAENANAVAAGFVSYVEGIRESQFIAARTELPNQLAELGEFALVGEVAESLGSTLENLLSSLSGVTLVTPAETPADSLPAPANHTVRNTAMALIAGILLSIPLVLILDYFRNPIGSAAMFQRRFGLSHLGTVPRWSKGIRGAGVLAVSSGADRETAEAIRQAAANVEFGARAWGINSIVMASPDKGEGQSSLMANLAVAISSRWKRVVVVDADLRHSSLHGYFGLGNQVGLASLLADPDLDVGNVIQDTKYDGLQVITGGDVPADPVALLKSPRMAGLIKRLESDYDLVLVDTPPMAALADGAVIASQVGAAIMVVNPTNAHIAGVKLALGNLEKANTRVLGFIWNRVARGSVARYVRYERESRSRGGTHAPGQLAPNSND